MDIHKDTAAKPVSPSAGTRQKLLEAGTEEFFQRGYQQASLRRICKACGVTTGAFYFYFSSKKELFCSIVDPVIERLLSLSQELVSAELEDPASNRDNDKRLMEFQLRYRRELILLMEKSQGSGREHIRELFLERLTHFFTLFFERELGHPPDPDIIRLLVDIRQQSNLRLLKENYDMEKTLFLNDILGCYAQGGFEYLIHNLKDRL